MGWLLWALLVGLAVVAGVILAVLVLPLDYTLRLDVLEDDARWEAGLRWAWGVAVLRAAGSPRGKAEFDLRLLGRIPIQPRRRGQVFPARRTRQPAVRQRPSGHPRAGNLGVGPWRRILRGDVLRALMRMAGRLWRALGLRLGGRLRYGWEDPALTGWLQGILAAIPLPPELRLRASYTDPGVNGWVQCSGTLVPLRAGWAAAVSLWEPPLRQIVWAAIRRHLRRFWRQRRTKSRPRVHHHDE